MGSVFNTRFLSESRGPEFESPIEARKRYLSLRQMMDLGKLRQVQLRQEELDNLKKQQDLEDDRRMREAFAGGIPEDASLSGLLQKFGKRGIDVYSQLRQAQAAESTRQTAKLTQEAAARKAQTEHEQQVADVLYGVRNIQDPGQRQAAMDEATMMDLMRPEAQRLGLGKIGEVTPLAPNEQQFRAKYATAYTPEKLGTLLNTERQATKEELDISDKQWKQAIPLFASATNQEGWTRAIKASPPQIQSFIDPNYSSKAKYAVMTMAASPGELARLTALNEPDKVIAAINDPNTPREDIPKLKATLAGMINYRQQVRPVTVQDTTGLVSSVLQNPALYSSLTKETQGKIIPALTDAGFQFPAETKPMSAEASKVHAIATTMIPELQELKEAIRTGGRTAIAGILSGTDRHLSRLASNAADKVGRLRSGGAVNPNEERRFMGQIAGWLDLWKGDTKPAESAIDGLIQEAQQVVGSITPKAAAPPAGGTATTRKVPLDEVMTGVPQVGQTFNGKRVTKVTKVK